MEGSALPATNTVADRLDPEALLRRTGAALMVLAPHPDDESLAAGGLIQRALALGVPVSVVFISDGENNPWPQRALERRARIDDSARVAWGQRRRAEADTALRLLGVDAARVHRLGWPDGGVTWMLLDRLDAMLAALRALFEQERPTLLVLPDLRDSHPDHGALHLLVALVFATVPTLARPAFLAYLLHGHARIDQGRCTSLALTDAERARKRQAIEAHASQMLLSRRRFLRFAATSEVFTLPRTDEGAANACLPWRPPIALRPWLSLLVVDAQGGVRLRLDGRDGGLRWRDGSPAARLPRPFLPPYYVKLYCRLPSPWVFDAWGWCRLGVSSA